MKYSEVTKECREANRSYINERWNQLNGFVQKYSDHAIRYIFFTNAGGAIAVLGFMGTFDRVKELTSPKVSLFFFLSGLLFAGFLNIWLLLKVSHIFDEWRKMLANIILMKSAGVSLLMKMMNFHTECELGTGWAMHHLHSSFLAVLAGSFNSFAGKDYQNVFPI